MTAPVFWLPSGHSAIVGGRVVVSGPEGHHAADVRRMRAGEAVELVDGAGLRVRGRVSYVRRGELTVEVRGVDREPVPDPRVVVVQALPKGDRGELAVELLTEVGVDEIVPWAAARCVAQWRERTQVKWRSTAREATKQARRAWQPVIAPYARTSDVVARLRSASLGLVLHESGAEPLAPVAVPAQGEIVVVVGPEGGISDDELAAFEPVARAVRLGPSVLRTSSAGAAAAVALLSRTPRWE